MKQIKLSQGKHAIVDDDDDFPLISRYGWYETASGYAMRTSIGQDKKRWLMHRLIMGALYNLELDVDHINGDRLDNRKSNLRVCLRMENNLNTKKKPNTSSQYKGVSWHVGKGKWSCKITYKGKQIYLGYYTEEIEAAKKYDSSAKELHGEFANLNFPRGNYE